MGFGRFPKRCCLSFKRQSSDTVNIKHTINFTQVDSEVRKEVLKMMHETKQSHFNDVMSGYTEEDSRGRLTPDLSLESKVCLLLSD